MNTHKRFIMNTETIIISSIVVFYLLPLFYNRWWFGKIYSKEGRWYTQDTGITELLLTIIPVISLVVFMSNLFYSPYYNKPIRNKKTLNKFFGVKK